MAKTEPFERYSDEYDKWFDLHPDLYAAELSAIRRLIPPQAEGMEVGVGSGKFAVPLGIRTGLDPSEKMADRARTRGIDVYHGIAERLPFPDGRFDYVLMVTTICFVDDVIASLQEAHRVLNSGGCIILGFVDRESEIGRQYLARKDDSRFYRDARLYSTTEVLRFLKESGFPSAEILQTIIPGQPPETVLAGYGMGSFVAIRGVKRECP